MKIKYSLTPYCGNKASYDPILDQYDTIIDYFGGSLGGTIQTVIVNPNANYYVAEASQCQRALIQHLHGNLTSFDAIKLYANRLIEEFFQLPNYVTASKWLSEAYQCDNAFVVNAALSVLRRFFFSSILRTTPGSGAINVWISVRKILGDTAWKQACKELYPDIDYTNLDTAQTKEFNANLGQALFENGVLKQYMIKSVQSWHKSIQPLLKVWFSEPRKLTVVSDYRELIDSSIIQGKTLLYIDPPYFNDNAGKFRDEAGRLRTHKQTPSYENHDPRSEATWDMFNDCVIFGFANDLDMVLCNYTSDRFVKALDALRQSYDLEVMVSGKAFLCTGKRSRYTTAPMGKEYVVFASPKVQTGVMAA